MGNLFDDLQLANQQLEIQINMLVQYKDKVKLWKEKGARIKAATIHDIRSYYNVGEVRAHMQ